MKNPVPSLRYIYKISCPWKGGCYPKVWASGHTNCPVCWMGMFPLWPIFRKLSANSLAGKIWVGIYQEVYVLYLKGQARIHQPILSALDSILLCLPWTLALSRHYRSQTFQQHTFRCISLSWPNRLCLYPRYLSLQMFYHYVSVCCCQVFCQQPAMARIRGLLAA